ncbi:MAG: phosphoribosylformylglycinamidine cyclo-ligase [Chloroflexi bacterium]|nr:phosphoribosylformylglycinamidine cyclo-ligase [Chloroflexota bacterium]
MLRGAILNDKTYKKAGVDLDLAAKIKKSISNPIISTHNKQVLNGLGSFGSMFELKGFNQPIIVSSTDGVGTKLKLAIELDCYDFIGVDLVNACVNDIVVCGAKPLFFLDYIAVNKLDNFVINKLISGMSKACINVGCALIGGETAQMPGIYKNKDFDMAGFVVGAVEKAQVLNPLDVKEQDVIIGLSSEGLHTNGYSLVRHALSIDENPQILNKFYSDLGSTLGAALLKPHISYVESILSVLPYIKSAAHITGGGLIENIPRAFSSDLAAYIDLSAWDVLSIFNIIQAEGNIAEEEMYKVFNMGLGMIVICDKKMEDNVLSSISGSFKIGYISKRIGESQVIF